MPTRAVHIVVDAADPSALAAFWAAALGWEVEPAADEPDEAVVVPGRVRVPGPAALPLVFVPVPDSKTGKNRLHLDLSTTSAQDQAAEVERLLALGAAHADIGQGEVPWEVLADPEGNEFCVLEPREVYMDARPVAAVVVDCARSAGRSAVLGRRRWVGAARNEPGLRVAARTRRGRSLP